MTESNTIAPIRRANLEAWMEKNDLSKSDLAGRLGVGRAYVSLIFRPDRFFGERSARSMELKLNMPTGYLDSDQSRPMPTENWSSPDDLSPDSYALVPRVYLEIKGGAVVDIEQNLPPLAFRRDWLTKRGVSSRDSLRVAEVSGDSMTPYIFDGDTVLIDMGQRDIKDGNVYAIWYADEVRVKRLCKRFDGGLFIRSDSKDYPEESLSPEQATSVRIIGRCIWRCG